MIIAPYYINFERYKYLENKGVRMKSIKTVISSILITAFLFSTLAIASPWTTAAKMRIKSKEWLKALDLLKKEITNDPESHEGYFLIGFVYARLNRIDEMLDAYKKSLALDEEYKDEIEQDKINTWALEFNKGVNYFQQANNMTILDSAMAYYDKSADAFRTAIKIVPDSTSTYRNLAFVLLNSQKYDEAIEPLQVIIDKDKSRDGYKFLGNIYYVKAKNLKNQFETSKDPKDSIAYMELFDKAINVLEAGKKVYPDDSNILLELSNSYIGANKTDVAINAFKEGVEKDPTNKYYHYNYGVLLLGAKKYQEAIEQFKAAEAIDPDYENALYNLGVVYVQWGDAIMKEEQAKDKDAKTDLYKTKYEAALPYLERVIQLNDKDASIWETLGKVYTRLGKTNDAANAFKKSDELR